jgi:hypothetical protein
MSSKASPESGGCSPLPREGPIGTKGMTRRTAARLSWTLVGFSIATLASGVAFHSFSTTGEGAALTVMFGTAMMAFPVVGALIVSRHPGHPIGWLFLAAGLANSLQALLSGYGSYSLATDPPRLPGAVFVTWVTEIIWLPSVAVSTTFLFLLFPDGQLPSRRWRAVAWAAVVGTAMVALASVFEPVLYYDPDIKAPLALPSAAQPFLDFLGGGGFFLWAGATLAAVVSLILRLRRARGAQRLQIKWVAFAALTSVLILVPSFFFEAPEALAFLEGLAVLAIPTSVGVAILRYRLYDIDRIINRTLVYAALTALLVGIYVGAAVGLGALVRSVTGQENNSLVIAASTLAVAALFRPARRGVQGFIDRRFYRGKYDAARTLEAFSARLREEVDLDSLTADLVGVVREAIQPAHVSLWLRPVEERR